MNRHTIALLMLFSAGLAMSQLTHGEDRWYAGRGIGAGYALGAGLGYGYGNYGGVGTAFSAQQNANANMVSAIGQANLMGSEAMINYEQARSAYLDNAQKWTEVYLSRRRMGVAQKEEEYQAAAAKREYGKQFLAANPPPPPARPNSSQLDASTGQIHWPQALQSAAYSEQRKSLENLFQLRTHTNTIPDLAVQVDNVVKDMKNELRKQVRDLPAQEYISTRKFLDSLVTEARSNAG